MEVGGAKREESAPLPSQQLSHRSSSSYRISRFPTAVWLQQQQQLQSFPVSNSSLTATAVAATEFPAPNSSLTTTAAATEFISFQQQFHCNSSSSYRISLFPTAVSLQQLQLQNLPLSNSSVTRAAAKEFRLPNSSFTATAAATEIPSFQQQSHCNSSSSYRNSLFPTAASLQQQQQLQNFPFFQQLSHRKSSSSYRIPLFLTATAVAAVEFPSLQQQLHWSCNALSSQKQICCGISSTTSLQPTATLQQHHHTS